MKKIILTFRLAFVMLIIISCSDEDKIVQEDYFMSAEINGVEWKAGREWFQLDFLYDLGYHRTDIYGEDESFNGINYNISIGHSYYPQLGKIYFNSKNDEVPYENGASGSISGWFDIEKNNFFTCSSTTGFIEITEINRYSMKGNFEFEASNHYHSNYGNYVVKKGKFFVPLTLVMGASWNGDYKK